MKRFFFLFICGFCLSHVVITGCAEEESGSSTIIEIMAQATGIAANGEASTLIDVKIHPDSTKRVVSLYTDYGTFLNEQEGRSTTTQLKVDQKGKAQTRLFSGTTVNTATVQAMIDQFSAETTVDFQRNYPDSIVMFPTQTRLTADGESSMVIGATLISSNGTVSQHTEVRFSATHRDTGEAVGYIIARAFSNEESQVTTQLFSTRPQDAPVIVAASVFNGDQLVAEGTVLIEFVKAAN
ncbi:MAG: hypothetical protein HQM12_20855 [SAR324 cluster bacterium]|nr:hypothetical protein [SAR324 cluster bacterium]